MSLQENIDRDFKEAMRARDDIRLSVLRMIKTAVKNKQVELRRPLEDEEFLGVLTSQAKQRRDSIDQFKSGGRGDLVDREEAELKIIETYLPQQLSRSQMEEAVAALIIELDAKSVKDMGRVMKALMSRFQGQLDGKAAGDLVKTKLS